LKDKTDAEILFNADRFAKEDLQTRSFDDPTYTEFFVAGGISYGEIELGLSPVGK
jgi:hypothetical protein